MLRTDREPEYRRRIREKAEKYEKEANDKRNLADKISNIHEIVLAIRAINQNYESERHKEQTRKRWDRVWEVAGVAGLWIAAAVRIAAIWVGTHDASEQHGVLQKTLVMSERPWLYMNGRLVTVSTVGTPIAARSTGPLTNLGKAIATKIQASGHFIMRTLAIGVRKPKSTIGRFRAPLKMPDSGRRRSKSLSLQVRRVISLSTFNSRETLEIFC